MDILFLFTHFYPPQFFHPFLRKTLDYLFDNQVPMHQDGFIYPQYFHPYITFLSSHSFICFLVANPLQLNSIQVFQSTNFYNNRGATHKYRDIGIGFEMVG